MKFSYQFPLDRPAQEAWAQLQDPDRLIGCIPGVEEVKAEDDGRYAVVLATGLGPVRLRFRGNAQVQMDDEARRMQADVSMSDARSGNVYGQFVLQVQEGDGSSSRLALDADVAIAGKLGEFAQPLLKRKADQVVKEFAKKVQEMTR